MGLSRRGAQFVVISAADSSISSPAADRPLITEAAGTGLLFNASAGAGVNTTSSDGSNKAAGSNRDASPNGASSAASATAAVHSNTGSVHGHDDEGEEADDDSDLRGLASALYRVLKLGEAGPSTSIPDVADAAVPPVRVIPATCRVDMQEQCPALCGNALYLALTQLRQRWAMSRVKPFDFDQVKTGPFILLNCVILTQSAVRVRDHDSPLRMISRAAPSWAAPIRWATRRHAVCSSEWGLQPPALLLPLQVLRVSL